MVLTSRSVQVTWNTFHSSCITGYLISYSTNASYTSGGNITINVANQTSYTLTNLEEYTEYYITVHVISNIGTSNNSNGVTVTTYTDSKYGGNSLDTYVIIMIAQQLLAHHQKLLKLQVLMEYHLL